MKPTLEVFAVGSASSSLLQGLRRSDQVVVLRGPPEAVAAAARLLYQQVHVVPAKPPEGAPAFVEGCLWPETPP